MCLHLKSELLQTITNVDDSTVPTKFSAGETKTDQFAEWHIFPMWPCMRPTYTAEFEIRGLYLVEFADYSKLVLIIVNCKYFSYYLTTFVYILCNLLL